jgi:hypothetical protein
MINGEVATTNGPMAVLILSEPPATLNLHEEPPIVRRVLGDADGPTLLLSCGSNTASPSPYSNNCGGNEFCACFGKQRRSSYLLGRYRTTRLCSPSCPAKETLCVNDAWSVETLLPSVSTFAKTRMQGANDPRRVTLLHPLFLKLRNRLLAVLLRPSLPVLLQLLPFHRL